MNSTSQASSFRKAAYCRCGLVFLDETGRVTAVDSEFSNTTHMDLAEGDLLPHQLRDLGPGQWTFYGDEWFVQAEGRQWPEVIVFRRVRAADRILGPYGDCTINEEMVRMVLDNPYEGLTVVDTEGKVTLLSAANERWFKLESGAGAGLFLWELAPGSRLAEVARSGVADSAQIVDLYGKTKITVNLPIRRENQVIGAFGRILFQSPEQLEKLVDRVRSMERKVERYETLLHEMSRDRSSFESILTLNPQLQHIIEQARRVANSSATVLILGESGTGKELFAQALHEASSRKNGPFVAINCGAIPHDLIESELFGYEEGAFSGARQKGKPGKFEIACDGTLFLDEIGELPVDSQAKLLRVLGERKIDRLGGTLPIAVNFRLIAATNRDLAALVRSGKFRGDLFYRLNEFPIEIPPLRSRPEDIPLLARHFLAEVCQREALPLHRLSEATVKSLVSHTWPGNVRELRSMIRQMAWKVQGLTIEPNHLPPIFPKDKKAVSIGTLEEQLVSAERNAIESALQTAAGNRALAARMLGIHRTALYKKMKRLGIEDRTTLKE